MKKLFTLVALLAIVLGAKAVQITDYTVDFTQKGSSTIGWKDDAVQAEWITADAEGVHFYNPAAMENWYTYQLWLVGSGIPVENDVDYTVTFVAKVSEGTANVRCKIGDWGGGFSAEVPVSSTEYQEYTFSGKGATDGGGFFIQFGDYVGTLSFKSLTVTHEGQEEKPATYLPVEELVNGNAESAWPEWALTEEGGINANWRGDRTAEICAWALTMGRNFDDQCPAEINSDSYRARPFPADIEPDPADASNHVFVVHVTEVADIEGGGDGSSAWSNQFWIQAPKAFKTGSQVRVKFRCKADVATTVPTQVHKIYPSNYLNSNGIGEIEFGTDWKEVIKDITWPEDGWSIAFNLTNSNKNANNYYIDDIAFEVMKLDEGFFVTATNTKTGLPAYNLAAAADMTYDAAEEAYVATVGTKGNEDSWVNEVMISTLRGYDKSFKGATIKPSTGNITGDDEDNWQDYVSAANAKITLPRAGVWQIFVAPVDKQILFMQLEGEEPVVKEPVAIVTNTTEVVVKGQERQPTATEQPADAEAGTPAGTGQAWDNQFFLLANREFKTGEKVTLKFKYKASKAAKTTTQLHGAPGAYVYWNAIGEVNFTEEWQDFSKTWEIAAGDNGAELTCKSIAFNMAEIKEACDYYIKDVQWYLSDESLEAEGKTYENLIDAEGTKNFFVKEGAGTAPYEYGTGTGIENVVNKNAKSSNVIYNLAGQRVSNSFKGLVIKDGKKFVK